MSDSTQALHAHLARKLPSISDVIEGLSDLPSRVLGRLQGAPESAVVCLRIAGARLRSGDPRPALKMSERAFALAVAEGDKGLILSALRTSAFSLLHIGLFGEVSPLLRQMRVLGGSDELSIAAADEVEAWLNLRAGSLGTSMYDEALDLLGSANDVYRHHGVHDREITCMEGISSLWAGLGKYMVAVMWADRALSRCEETGCWASLHRILLARVQPISDQGYHALAEPEFYRALEWAEALEDQFVVARTLSSHGAMPRYQLGERDEPGENLRKLQLKRSIQICGDLGLASTELCARLTLVRVYEASGEPEQAAEQRDAARILADKTLPVGTDKIYRFWESEIKQMDDIRSQRAVDRLRQTTESTPSGLFVFDPVPGAPGMQADFICEVRNSVADELLGASREDVYTLGQLSDLPHFQGMPEQVQRVVATGAEFQDEIQVLAGGGSRWFLRKVLPSAEGVALSLTETTSYHETEQRYREAAERAHVAVQARSRFLATMSHEIRTPINGVLGLARMLTKTGLDPLQREYVGGIISGADVLLGVVGDVLDLSKIEENRLTLDPAPTDVKTLLLSMDSLYAGQAQEKGVLLTSRSDGDVPRHVLLDAARLSQVLANLVNNAIRYTDVGSVVLSVDGVKGGNGVDDVLRFAVTDTGRGISEYWQSRIFNAFEQGPLSRGGTGLGLAISSRLVALMGGTLQVESELGKGSRFWFDIPRVAVESVAGEADCPMSCGRFSGIRVLLAEDNRVNALVARSQLEDLGCYVVHVVTGVQAVDACRSQSFDLVLMDVRMPEMDGLEATQKIRELSGRCSKIPIVALTAGALTDEREECFDAGMSDFITKPMAANSIPNVLHRWAFATAQN